VLGLMDNEGLLVGKLAVVVASELVVASVCWVVVAPIVL